MEFLLQDKGDGGEFILESGDIKQDNTFYTSVYLSLFSGDCFSNSYSEYKSDKKFEESLSLPITPQNSKTVETEAQNALNWMITEGVASSVETNAYGDSEGRINVEITITEPDGSSKLFAVTWTNQKTVMQAK